MKSYTKRIFKRSLLSAAMSALTLSAYAGGFQLSEGSLTNLGNAFAGAGATAEDASTEYTNPAGMTLLKHKQLSVSGTLLDVNINGHFQSATNSGSFGGIPATPVSVTGAKDVSAGGWALIPAFHYVYPIQNLAFGFGFTTPYGLATNYPDDSIARYMSTLSKLQVYNLNPSIAYQVTPQLSLGAGVDFQYLKAALNQSVSVPALTSLLDGTFTNKGDDWGYGWNAGALYQYSPKTRIGLSYRSSVTHNLKGSADLVVPGLADIDPAFGGPYPTNYAGSVSTSLILPASTDLSLYHDISSKWGLVASLDYTQWSEIKSLILNYSGAVSNVVQSVSLPLNFRDTLRYSLGANYYASPRWTFQGGLAFDESPVPNDSSRTLRLPDSNRIWAAFGAKYTINDRLSINAAYAHLFVNNANTDNSQTFGGLFNGAISYSATNSIVGNFNSDVNEFGLQLNWKFM